ncbi:MAG: FUSC family protein [Acidimicrobiia bacterium]|nr:FUSC family protein [Acidimicrobiia bacterium]
MAAGGVWAFVLVELVLRRDAVPEPSARAPVGRHDAVVFGAALGVAAGVGNAVVAAIDLPHGAWVNLTLFIVAMPSVHDTVRKIVERAGGTVVGGALAVAIAQLLPWPDVWLVLALLLVPPMLITTSRYWLYTVLLTMVIVFSESPTADALVETDLYRVLLTVATSGAVLVIALSLHAILGPAPERA